MKSKRILSILMTLCMVLNVMSVMSLTVSAETLTSACGDSATYTLDTDTGVLTIGGTGDMYDYAKGYSSSSTGEKTPWYDSNSSITSVVVGSGITYIGNNAFAQTSATSITIPESVTKIGEGAFAYTPATSITLPESLETIGEGAFKESHINTINIPANVTSIGTTPFYASRYLTAITVDSGNTVYSADNGVLYQGTTLIAYPYSKKDVTEYKIKDGTTAIANYAIWCNSTLTNVEMPNSVTSIGSGVFSDCSNMASIEYDGTMTEWENISGNDNVSANIAIICTDGTIGGPTDSCGENATWKLENGILTISGTGAMTDYDSLSDVPWYNDRSKITEVVIESGITSIGKNAFYNCHYLTDVSVPETLTSIGTYAFGLCSKLASIDIPESVTTIKSSAFTGTDANIVVNYGGTKSAWESISANAQLSATATVNYGKFEVSFDANGGSGTMTDVTVTNGDDYTLPENGFTAPEGEQFAGWATTADGTVIDTSTITVTEDTTLYAIWEDYDNTINGDLDVADKPQKINQDSSKLDTVGVYWDSTNKVLHLKDITVNGNILLEDDCTIIVYGDVTVTGNIDYMYDYHEGNLTIVGNTGTSDKLTVECNINMYASSLTVKDVTTIANDFYNYSDDGILTFDGAIATANDGISWFPEDGVKLTDSTVTVNTAYGYSSLWAEQISMDKTSKLVLGTGVMIKNYGKVTGWLENLVRYIPEGYEYAYGVKENSDKINSIVKSADSTIATGITLQYQTKITFDPNGGTGTAVEKYYLPNEYIQELQMPDVLGIAAPEGKQFSAWSSDTDGISLYISYNVPDIDTTLYAIWMDIPVYTAIDKIDVTIAEPVAGKSAEFISSIPTDKGYLGADDTYTTYNPTVGESYGLWFESSTANVDTFDPTTYDAYYSFITPFEFEAGKYYTYETFLFANLTDNYYFDTTVTGTINGGADTAVVDIATEEIIYVYRTFYCEPPCTVSFDANGGTGTMNDVTVTNGDDYTLPENGFTAPSEKQFKGWATTVDGTVIDTSTITITADITLYAVWEDVSATVTPTPPTPTPSVKPSVKPIPNIPVFPEYITEDVSSEAGVYAETEEIEMTGRSVFPIAAAVIAIAAVFGGVILFRRKEDV